MKSGKNWDGNEKPFSSKYNYSFRYYFFFFCFSFHNEICFWFQYIVIMMHSLHFQSHEQFAWLICISLQLLCSAAFCQNWKEKKNQRPEKNGNTQLPETFETIDDGQQMMDKDVKHAHTYTHYTHTHHLNNLILENHRERNPFLTTDWQQTERWKNLLLSLCWLPNAKSIKYREWNVRKCNSFRSNVRLHSIY